MSKYKTLKEHCKEIGAIGGSVRSLAKKKAASIRMKKIWQGRAVCNECNKRVTKNHACNPWLD